MAKRKKKAPRCPTCGKHCFGTFAAAVRSVNGRIKRGAPPLRIYQAHGFYHMTKQPQ